MEPREDEPPFGVAQRLLEVVGQGFDPQGRDPLYAGRDGGREGKLRSRRECPLGPHLGGFTPLVATDRKPSVAGRFGLVDR
jgi:hypothetical protein